MLESFPRMRKWLQDNFGKKRAKIAFCHNDLNAYNIFIKNSGKRQKECLFIDFEYAGYNYVAYDIANFLNESTISYEPESPGFKVLRKITKEDIHKVCSLYKKGYPDLERDVRLMMAMVNYFWAIWSLKTKPTSNSKGFSPLKHGKMRM